MRKIAFPPIVDKDSRILLLGTMPGEESLRLQQYYGHKSNQFWKILFTLFNKPFFSDYEERKKLVKDNNIALWDVLSSCEGEGSADSCIKNEAANDFESFFAAYPQIKVIFFTSAKAAEFYKRYIGFDDSRTYHTLPSPSSAYAKMRLKEKIEKWKVLLSI